MRDKMVVFHPGTQHSWQTALALQQLDRLEFFATSIFYQPDRWPYRLERYVPTALAHRLHGEFLRFSQPDLDPGRVRTSGLSEWLERIAQRGGLRRLAARINDYGNRRFGESLEREVASDAPFGLWGYSGSSYGVFKARGAEDRVRVLDRTIGDWRAYNRIMAPVQDRYPEFFAPGEWRIGADEIARDDEEYSLADVILTGSPFACETVRDHAADRSAAKRVRVLEYCFDESAYSGDRMPTPTPGRDAPLRFVMLGQANVRKGIHLVLKVFERIPRSAASLLIVGDLQVPQSVFARYADRVQYRRTVARPDVPAVLAEADVMLFPSYFEGAGIVLYEALASGVALIQSRNAAPAVTPATGILLDELDETSLEAAIWQAIDDRDLVAGWRSRARAASRANTFDVYRENIERLMRELYARPGS